MSFTIHDVQVRRDICGDCRESCDEHRAGKIAPADPCAACPRRVWHARGNCHAHAQPAPLKPAQIAAAAALPVGLGDLVERYAHPVARWIDARTAVLPPRCRTQLAAGCSPCRGRRHRLNRWVRDIRSLKAWIDALKKLLS